MCVCVSEKQESWEDHTISPGLVDGGFLPELLCEMVKPFQPANLIQQPLFVALLGLFQVLPTVVDILEGSRGQGYHRS